VRFSLSQIHNAQAKMHLRFDKTAEFFKNGSFFRKTYCKTLNGVL